MNRLIIHTGKRGGISFCGKRVTSDDAVLKDIAENYGDGLMMDFYTGQKYINATGRDFVGIDEFGEKGGSVFIEIAPIPDAPWDEIVVYEYARIYPFDRTFVVDRSRFRCRDKLVFPGDSHDKITKRVYVAKKAGV